jgi:hypothetical protein
VERQKHRFDKAEAIGSNPLSYLGGSHLARLSVWGFGRAHMAIAFCTSTGGIADNWARVPPEDRDQDSLFSHRACFRLLETTHPLNPSLNSDNSFALVGRP